VTITKDIMLPPKGKARPRVCRGHAFMPKDYMKWKRDFGLAWGHCLTPITGRVCVDVIFYTKTGNSRSDIDNAYAAVADALQDCGQIANDRQIIKGSFDLFKDTEERITVTIRLLADLRPTNL